MKKNGVMLISTAMAVVIGACGKEFNNTSKVDESAVHEIFEKFVNGDRSYLEEGWENNMFVPDFTGDEVFSYEYAFMDLDSDGTDELIIQMEDDPGAYNGVFHFDGKYIQCWCSDSVEMTCYFVPLNDGLMVEEYDYAGSISYQVFRYLSNGERETVTNLFCREEPLGQDETEKCPYYEINDKEVSKEEFYKELEQQITSKYLEKSAWTKA